MEMLEMLKHRRSIRKYLENKVEKEKLEKIAEAGIFAPSPGGRQGTKIIMLEDTALIEKIGIVNANCENRNWGGNSVSADQPSIIDDLSIKSGFYGCPALGIVCVPKTMAAKVNGIGSAFVSAENMVMEACDLGVSSCIVGRAEATFSHPEMADLLSQWGLDEEYTPMVFVCMGYINGEYPKVKARNEGRVIWAEKNIKSLQNDSIIYCSNNKGRTMGLKEKTKFSVDKTKCIRCGRCINVCSGMVIRFGSDDYPEMKEFERYGWRGCWRCEHCLAVCPTGAISIFAKKPENSLPPPPTEMGSYMEQLVVNRRSCRRYLDQNVDPEIISRIIRAMAAAPTGGNSCGVEYTVIDDKERVRKIWELAYQKMDADAKKHIYTSSFDDFYYGKMKQSERTVRKDDLLFCGAPHLFIAHQKCTGKWAEDTKINCNIATTYFELLANAFGLGTVIMSYPSDVLQELAPEARKLLGIPTDHYMKLLVGFGYPEIPYARGVQKDRSAKVHRYSLEK